IVPAADALVDALVVVVPVGAREGAFRSLLPRDAVLLRREALLPLFVGLLHSIHHDESPLLGGINFDLLRQRRSCDDAYQSKNRDASFHAPSVDPSRSIAWSFPTSTDNEPPGDRR